MGRKIVLFCSTLHIVDRLQFMATDKTTKKRVFSVSRDRIDSRLPFNSLQWSIFYHVRKLSNFPNIGRYSSLSPPLSAEFYLKWTNDGRRSLH